MMRLTRLWRIGVWAALAASGCDFTPALDIETPPFEEMAVVRAVLVAGEPATVRVSRSRDPYGPGLDYAERRVNPTPTAIDATVTLLRDGEVVEVLTARPQTCHERTASTCNEVTGETETERSGPFECGAHVGAAAIEAGATYTLRVEVPGLPEAAATVTVPTAPAVALDEEPSPEAVRRLRMRLRDPPGPTRYGFSVYREYDASTGPVCRVGGPRDTTFTFAPRRYREQFETSDPVLLAGSRLPGDLGFVTFADDAFEGAERTFAVELAAAPSNPTVHATGGLTAQLAVLSVDLFEVYQLTYFSLGDASPFAEPANLPSNVVGGLGRVGAAALTEVALPPRE